MRIIQIIIPLLLLCSFTTAEDDYSTTTPVFQEFIKQLKADKYKVTVDTRDRDLDFGTDKGDIVKTPKGSCFTVFTKRSYPLKKPTGGWYPRFSVTEIRYSDSLTAAKECKKIDKIISGSDRMNDKSYDFIIQNGSSLIYVVTGARIYMEYTFAYKPVLQKIISQKSH